MFKLGGTRTDGNPIKNLYEMGKQVATGGPEGAWRVYEGHRKNDGKLGGAAVCFTLHNAAGAPREIGGAQPPPGSYLEVSIFVFEKKIAEKVYKPKRRETVTELLRAGVKQLERLRHPRILQVVQYSVLLSSVCPQVVHPVEGHHPTVLCLSVLLSFVCPQVVQYSVIILSSVCPQAVHPVDGHSVVHPVEECAETLSFASEPVLACLANVLTAPPADGEKTDTDKQGFSRDYTFLDVELKYGILQVSRVLQRGENSPGWHHAGEKSSGVLYLKCRLQWIIFFRTAVRHFFCEFPYNTPNGDGQRLLEATAAS
ncbi:SCY1-like protein 2 [Amphibalanus amphitrite]|uniref:SCY1-like protein 2 n=1 Tax=Amphibalanus amphitrite TaxID=1232801 RepID=A0A6A4W9B5_AMPAM|nr:SCY1-like protein 2 [Amphibalanus amphitrite]